MDQIRIVFLGTGAAAPTRDRNVSSVAIALDGRVLLFDCGEATQHQLMRSPLRSGAIEAIFITHLHGDHLYGLPGLIATLGLNARSAPLPLYGPPGLERYVRSIPHLGATYPIEIHEIHDDRVPQPSTSATTRATAQPVTPLPAGEGGSDRSPGERSEPGEGRATRENPVSKRPRQPGIIRRARGYHVEAALLDHSVPCFGYAVVEDDRPGTFNVAKARELGVPDGPLFGRLQHGSDVTINGHTVKSADVVGPKRPGRRIAFCTDTRPSEAAASLAKDADVLIHEATYARDHAQDAIDRWHSTAEEAAGVAAVAHPRELILTHVSARYESDEPLIAEAAALFPDTFVAKDLLVVPVSPRE